MAEGDTTTTKTADTTTADTTTKTADTTTTTKTADATTTTTTAAAADWRDSIADAELKEHAKRFASPADAVKNHFELRKQLSSAIRVPGKDAKPEEIADYRKRIGVPDTADGYKFETVDGKEPTDQDKAFQKVWADQFHKLNIPAETARELSKAWNAQLAAAQAAQVQADKDFAAATDAALKKEWGNDYDANKQFAARAAARLFGAKLNDARLIEGKDGRFVLDHPLMLQAFAAIGREMGEDGLRGTMTDTDRNTLQDQITAADAEYYKAYHSGNRELAAQLDKKRSALYAKMHGNAPIVGSQGRAA